MKTLTLRLVFPLTIISFAFVTKWWYALPEDAPETIYKGFPLVYSGAAWHTSLAYQVFVMELLIDWLTYFLCWFLLTGCIRRFWFNLNPSRLATSLLWGISILILAYYISIASLVENAYDFKRPYSMKIIATGYEFFWHHTQHP